LEVIGSIAIRPTHLDKNAFFGQTICHMQQFFRGRSVEFCEYMRPLSLWWIATGDRHSPFARRRLRRFSRLSCPWVHLDGFLRRALSSGEALRTASDRVLTERLHVRILSGEPNDPTANSLVLPVNSATAITCWKWPIPARSGSLQLARAARLLPESPTPAFQGCASQSLRRECAFG
jgi:hypothetical protein